MNYLDKLTVAHIIFIFIAVCEIIINKIELEITE